MTLPYAIGPEFACLDRKPMRVGIVGSEAVKFTPETEAQATSLIAKLISAAGVRGLVSGGCHLGGVDIYAEEEAAKIGLDYRIIHKPRNLQWSTGYKSRNLAIARDSDEVHCITVRELPPSYKGMRFRLCYHCAKEGPGFADVPHVKSGGCWTMHQARKIGKKGYLHVI